MPSPNLRGEALRSLQKDKTDKKKVDLFFGNIFIKMPKHKTKALLEKDHEQLDDKVDGIHKSLKVKVNKFGILKERKS